MHHAEGFIWTVTCNPKQSLRNCYYFHFTDGKLRHGDTDILQNHISSWTFNSGRVMLEPVAPGSRLNCWKLQNQLWGVPPFYFRSSRSSNRAHDRSLSPGLREGLRAPLSDLLFAQVCFSSGLLVLDSCVWIKSFLDPKVANTYGALPKVFDWIKK